MLLQHPSALVRLAIEDSESLAALSLLDADIANHQAIALIGQLDLFLGSEEREAYERAIRHAYASQINLVNGQVVV